MKLYRLIPESKSHPAANIGIGGCSRDPRTVRKDEALFLFRGVNYPHDLEKNLRSRKPAVIITDTDIPDIGIPVVAVGNARRTYAFAEARHAHCDFSVPRFVGITGTNGKTTTATFLASALRRAGRKVGFFGTGKILSGDTLLSDPLYSMTTPDPDVLYPALKRMEDDGCDVIVAEVSSHALALEKVAPIPFDVAVFTGLSPEHLDFHRDMERYFSEKVKLFRQAKAGIVSIDAPYGERMAEAAGCEILRLGAVREGDRVITDVSDRGRSGTCFSLAGERFLVPLPGLVSVYDAALAALAAEKLGVPLATSAKAIAHTTVEGRAERITDGDLTVYIDYAHTPAAMRAILSALARCGDGKLVTVFGCGGDRDREKRPDMARAAEEYSDFVILTGDNPRTEDPERILTDTRAGFRKDNHTVIPDRAEAITHAVLSAEPSDTVAILGKGHEQYIIDKAGSHPFDERGIIRQALTQRRKQK